VHRTFEEVGVTIGRRRFELYRTLSETLEAKFADDVIEYFQQARQDSKGSHAA
jgi:hypothetical protein